jgi:hypothetical protein
VSAEFIDTTAPLTAEDPSLEWMRSRHADKLAMRETPHVYVHAGNRDPRDTCPPEGSPGCVCEACWERKSARIHKAVKP